MDPRGCALGLHPGSSDSALGEACAVLPETSAQAKEMGKSQCAATDQGVELCRGMRSQGQSCRKLRICQSLGEKDSFCSLVSDFSEQSN